MWKIRRAREGDVEHAVEVDRPERVDPKAKPESKRVRRAAPGDVEKRSCR